MPHQLKFVSARWINQIITSSGDMCIAMNAFSVAIKSLRRGKAAGCG
jgi:hypothetical protein